MDKSQILVSVFLILLKCEELTMQNVTFSNGKKSWKDAVNYCSVRGGVLESNITLLGEQDEFKNVIKNDEKLWIGKFKTLTNWTYIRGCYLLEGNFQHFEIEISNTAKLQCQMLCNEYKFYSIKEAECFCIANISSFVRRKNCNCEGCYKVWEHQLPYFGSEDRNSKCIATTSCDGENFQRVYKECDNEDNRYIVICDNDAYLGYSYTNYQDAADQCEIKGSFIKWHSICNSTGLPPYWTSGTRHKGTFVIRKAYFTENLQSKKCFILKKNGGEERINCDDDFRFFCRFETNEDKGNIISIPNLSTPPQNRVQSDDSGSIAAGTVTSIIVVIAVISVLVFIYRQRLSRKKPASHESQNNSRLQDTVGLSSNYEISKAPIYHEIEPGPHSGKLNSSRTVNNITYDQTPNPKNVNQSANSSILTNLNSIEHQRKVGHTEYDIPKLINETGISSDGANTSNYCLAEPIATNTEEELDPYDINKDYDHLNNVMKKEDQITKVYDHLPTAVTDDPTYDHSNLKSALDNEDFYDHFKNDGDHD